MSRNRSADRQTLSHTPGLGADAESAPVATLCGTHPSDRPRLSTTQSSAISWLSTFCLLATILFSHAPGAEADRVVAVQPHLPTPRSETTVISTDSGALIIGGHGSAGISLSDVLLLEPKTQEPKRLPIRLPAIEAATGVWTGDAVFLFGGRKCVPSTGCTPYDAILRINLETGAVDQVATNLPSPRWRATAVWDGRYAYVLGGETPSGVTDEVLRYDPATGVVERTNARLPTARSAAALGWDGTRAYLFGGWDGQRPLSEILNFDPASGNVSVGAARLPSPRSGAAAVEAGGAIYIVGGGSEGAPSTATIWRYLPAEEALAPLSSSLARPTAFAGAANVGGVIHVFGGRDRTLIDAIQSFVPPISDGDAAVVRLGSLPEGRVGAAAVWAGEDAFIVGGAHYDRMPTSILRWSPRDGALTATGANLPEGRLYASAVWTGTHVLIFGGVGPDWAARDTILRYDPANGKVDTFPARLPSARDQTGAAWDGENAYVFGGWLKSGRSLNEIVRVTPSTGEVQAVEATFPLPIRNPIAVWDDHQFVYIVGGVTCRSSLCPEEGIGFARHPSNQHIFRYDPSRDALETMSAQFHVGPDEGAAVWDGENVLAFGGAETRQIVRYNPDDDAVVVMNATLPAGAHTGMVAVWGAGRAYLFGGTGSGIDAVPTAQIHSYEPTPDAPIAVAVTSQPVAVSWLPPSPSSYSGTILGYRVYRSIDGNEPVLLAEVPATAQIYSDEGCAGVDLCSYRVSALTRYGEGRLSAPVSNPGVAVDADSGERHLCWIGRMLAHLILPEWRMPRQLREC